MVNGISTVSANGTFSAKVNLVEGNNTIMAIATDVFGNTGSESLVVVVDTKPPVVEITAPSPATVVNNRTVIVSGIADKNTATVAVSGGKGPAVQAVVNAGTFTAKEVKLEEGVNTITARAVSLAGNAGTATVRVTVDSIAPVVTISSPKNLLITNKKMVTVSGTVDDATALVRVNNTPVQVERGSFTLLSVNLNEGGNTVTVTATDRAGNQAKPAVITVTLDTTPPSAPTIAPVPQVTRNPQLTVSGTAEPGAEVEVYVNSSSKGRIKADEKGAYTLKAGLTEGNNAMTAVAYDANGNSSMPSAVANVFLDTKAPKIL
jgi:hypothetical protein